MDLENRQEESKATVHSLTPARNERINELLTMLNKCAITAEGFTWRNLIRVLSVELIPIMNAEEKKEFNDQYACIDYRRIIYGESTTQDQNRNDQALDYMANCDVILRKIVLRQEEQNNG